MPPSTGKTPQLERWILESDSYIRRTTFGDGDVRRTIVRTYDRLSNDVPSSHGEVRREPRCSFADPRSSVCRSRADGSGSRPSRPCARRPLRSCRAPTCAPVPRRSRVHLRRSSTTRCSGCRATRRRGRAEPARRLLRSARQRTRGGPVSTKRCARMAVADAASARRARQWKAMRCWSGPGKGSASDHTSGRPKLDRKVSSATMAGWYDRRPL